MAKPIHRLEMATVMMIVIHWGVTMMAEIVVDHVCTKSTVQFVLVLMEDQAIVLLIILILLEMVSVMMDLTMLNVSLMEEIAVGLMLIQIIAQYVNAMKKVAFRVGLLMEIAMMSTTMKPASLMEEIAVAQMSIHNIAQIAYVLKAEGEAVNMVGLLMGGVMISITI